MDGGDTPRGRRHLLAAPSHCAQMNSWRKPGPAFPERGKGMTRNGNNGARRKGLGQREERRSPWSVPATGLRTMRGTISRTSPRNSCGEMPPIEPSMPWLGAAATPGSLPGHGGCTFLADPADDPLVRPACWRAESSPFVLRIDSPGEGIGIRGTILQRDIVVGEVRYLVLRGTFGAHRIELAVNARSATPSVALRLDASLLPRLGCLEALVSGKPDVPLRLRPTPYQASRLGLMLAVLDRLGEKTKGTASLRAIATEFAFPGAALAGRAIEWKSSSIRRQTQRLIASAMWLRDGGYRHLLHGLVRVERLSEPKCFVTDDAAP